MGALTADREALAVAKTLVAADFDLASNVCSNLASQVTFDLEVLIDPVTQSKDLLISEVLGAQIGANAGGLKRIRSL